MHNMLISVALFHGVAISTSDLNHAQPTLLGGYNLNIVIICLNGKQTCLIHSKKSTVTKFFWNATSIMVPIALKLLPCFNLTIPHWIQFGEFPARIRPKLSLWNVSLPLLCGSFSFFFILFVAYNKKTGVCLYFSNSLLSNELDW